MKYENPRANKAINYRHVLIFSCLSPGLIQYKMVSEWITHQPSLYDEYLNVINDITNNKSIYVTLNIDQKQINNLSKIIGQRNKLNMLKSYV